MVTGKFQGKIIQESSTQGTSLTEALGIEDEVGLPNKWMPRVPAVRVRGNFEQ